MRRWIVRTLALAAVGLLVTACAAPDLPFLSKSSDQLAAAAVNSLSQAQVLHVQGTLTGDKPYRVDVTGRPNGAAVGAGTYGGLDFSYLDVGGKQYLKGAQFWQGLYTDSAMQRQARGYQDNWVVAGQSPVTTLLGLVVSPITLAPTLGAHAKQVTRGNTVQTPAGPAVALRDGGITYYVTTSNPVRLVRVRTAGGYREPAGVSDVQLDVSYPQGMPSLVTPSRSLDPGDPATLPALYEAQAVHDVQPCDTNSCTFQITLRNKGGAPDGATTVTFHVVSTEADRQEVGSCTAPVPAAAHDQQVTVSCAIAGQGWSDYLKGGHSSYISNYTYRNPPYDP